MTTAIVTGANRGIGLETCAQLARHGCRVVLTARDAAQGQRTAARLAAQGLDVTFHALDVTDAASIAAIANSARDWGGLDILVNNAGVSLSGFDADVVRRTLAVNFYGALQLTDALLPFMNGGGSIVMVSSGMGELSCLSGELQRHFSDPALTRAGLLALMAAFQRDVQAGTHRARGWPGSAYRVSKVGLNALTRVLDAERRGRALRVNAVCPGWVRTGMGGRLAPRGVAKGADGIVWAALAGADGPHGGFFRDRLPIPW